MKLKLSLTFSFFLIVFLLTTSSCKKYPLMSLAEIETLKANNDDALIKSTISKPYRGQAYKAGTVGGVWQATVMSEPKTFNALIAERDATSAGIVSMTTDYLVEYDLTSRQWLPHCAFFEIETDKAHDRLTVHYTLRPNLYWTFPNSSERVKVTSRDITFWYNEVSGNEAFASSAWAQQQVTLADGSTGHVDCIELDDERFDFVFPRIVSEPLLATNMELAPAFIYEKAFKEGGVDKVKNVFSSDVDVTTIPSCGKWYIASYTPGQRLVFTRNPNYWERDEKGKSIPYPEVQIFQIIGDANTDYLLFKQGKNETYSPTPENIYDVAASQSSDGDGYTVFNSEGSLGAQFISFNQNPKNAASPYYKWFVTKAFRQALSCLINRERLISNAYRSLASPKYSFFPEPNPFYNPAITLQYRYDPKRALSLLKSAGFSQDKKTGTLLDPDGNKVEFNLTTPSGSSTTYDVALIIADECAKVGIKVNIRQTDFQKMVEMLTNTFDWEAIILAFGASIFPSQGSNVWPSYGNLHLWHPFQKEAATDWERRLDYLYNEGCYTTDTAAAAKIWDEFQSIILEQCPLIYLVRPKSFFAIRNKWDQSNFYFDNKNGAKTDWVYLR